MSAGGLLVNILLAQRNQKIRDEARKQMETKKGKKK